MSTRFWLISFFILNTLFSFGATPPDSSATLIQRTAALLAIEEGKNYFYTGKYLSAIMQFKEANRKDKYGYQPYFWLGKCHFALDNFGEAAEYVEKSAALLKEENLDVLILQAQTYHQLNKIDEALAIYLKLKEKLPKVRLRDLQIDENITSCELIKEQLAEGRSNQRKALSQEINTDFSEYAPILLADGKTLYFTSRRENTTGGRHNPDDSQFFEDNYRVVWNDKSKKWDSLTNQMDRINSTGFDCISYLSADGLEGLMTVNTTATQEKDITNGSDIYEISFSSKGKWQTPKSIKNKSINTSFFDGSATMTADKSRMYFVSDRKGNKSMTDIYMVERSGNKWGTAVPVSDSINTPYNETTPYITPDGRFLFFSSNGHQGLGGYDIFVSENLGNTWSKPINLGIEINSVNDDTHFQYYPKLQKALFAGLTLNDLRGNIDIFEVDLKLVKLPIKE